MKEKNTPSAIDVVDRKMLDQRTRLGQLLGRGCGKLSSGGHFHNSREEITHITEDIH